VIPVLPWGEGWHIGLWSVSWIKTGQKNPGAETIEPIESTEDLKEEDTADKHSWQGGLRWPFAKYLNKWRLKMKELRLALAGNPNAGKSTIFNALTGSKQHVGNWPGKTVEKKEGKFIKGEYEIEVVDLPGTYSLTAYSPEEVIARDYIINEKPDMVVTVVDAANLERNLYLTVQVLELGVPVIVALNMADMANSHGLKINQEMLSKGLQSPVVSTTANKGIGIDTLITTILNLAKEKIA
jgi:ferrous iron transport protein B